MHVFKFFQNI